MQSQEPLYRKSMLLETLDSILLMQDKIQIVSDMAFDAVDTSGDGSLSRQELGRVLRDVAKSMQVQAPSDTDVQAVLSELDADGDGEVDKMEFRVLIKSVLEKMRESEYEL